MLPVNPSWFSSISCICHFDLCVCLPFFANGEWWSPLAGKYITATEKEIPKKAKENNQMSSDCTENVFNPIQPEIAGTLNTHGHTHVSSCPCGSCVWLGGGSEFLCLRGGVSVTQHYAGLVTLHSLRGIVRFHLFLRLRAACDQLSWNLESSQASQHPRAASHPAHSHILLSS